MTEATDNLIPCPGCGARFPKHNGPTHQYLESTPGCWAAYGDVLAREYADPDYMKVHHLTADTYPVQHPGKQSQHNMKSVVVHLIGLYAALELELSQEKITTLRDGAIDKIGLHWLEPPEDRGYITVADIVPAQSAEEHRRLVHQWAQEVWRAWACHHDQVRQWVDDVRRR